MNAQIATQSKESKEGEEEKPQQPQLVALARAVLWTRVDGSDIILRIIGDGELLLRSHTNERVTVTVQKRDGEPLLIFNGRLTTYKSQGRNYLVVHLPRRLAPMVNVLKSEVDEDGALVLQVALSGIKVKPRGKMVKEEVRRG
jgi:hypothetical protein